MRYHKNGFNKSVRMLRRNVNEQIPPTFFMQTKLALM